MVAPLIPTGSSSSPVPLMLNSALKVTEMICLQVQSFMPKAENVDSLVSDLARVYSGELTLDECGDLLYKTHASQVAQLQLFISTVKFSRLNLLCIWKRNVIFW